VAEIVSDEFGVGNVAGQTARMQLSSTMSSCRGYDDGWRRIRGIAGASVLIGQVGDIARCAKALARPGWGFSTYQRRALAGKRDVPVQLRSPPDDEACEKQR